MLNHREQRRVKTKVTDEASAKSGKIKQKKVAKKMNKTEVCESESSENDVACLYCKNFYSKSTEGWVAWRKGHKWSHNSCVRIDSDDDKTQFMCELCT